MPVPPAPWSRPSSSADLRRRRSSAAVSASKCASGGRRQEAGGSTRDSTTSVLRARLRIRIRIHAETRREQQQQQYRVQRPHSCVPVSALAVSQQHAETKAPTASLSLCLALCASCMTQTAVPSALRSQSVDAVSPQHRGQAKHPRPPPCTSDTARSPTLRRR
ncbi:hypothetical protein HBI81_126640 [Parastagonospora nodorum]|nr:hypothetical protein HBI10_140730 [Parastagonospora nodorum]KAH4020939.1 hypothetical protein HBI13_109030 [Parastagonospora nodorum]KAH4053568.1 hypothetical protein HBH49_085460 [Parastagonospora nodorum]KAH4220888.1 hypothetical protein HBI06_166670 [Parastagonospora nodorum]KAH4237282.1 hypothetical protein HBI05_129090 [Parastagonospora nodorum]